MRPFGLRVKLPAVHLSATHGGGFTLFDFIADVKQESCGLPILIIVGLNGPRIEPVCISVADALSTRPRKDIRQSDSKT